jgi:hypothetical protein
MPNTLAISGDEDPPSNVVPADDEQNARLASRGKEAVAVIQAGRHIERV